MGDMTPNDAQLAAPGSAQQKYAEGAAATIVGVMKDLHSGKPLDLDDESIAEALEYSKGMLNKSSRAIGAVVHSQGSNVQVYIDLAPALPHTINLQQPTIVLKNRSSEAYFVLWSLTKAGRAKMWYWTSFFPGLRYKRSFTKFEVQRFIRELLTMGTRLNRVDVHGLKDYFTTTEMLAFVFLISRTRIRSMRGAIEQVQCLFGANTRTKAKKVEEEIAAKLEHEELHFDNDFVNVANTEQGSPIFFMAMGHENKILKENWYNLGQVGYFEIDSSNVENQHHTLLSMPPEIKLNILQYLFKLKPKIHVFLDPDTPDPPHGFRFWVWGPNDYEHDSPPIRHSGEVGPFDGLFSLALVNREMWALVRQVFYQDNIFILGPFDDIDGVADTYGYHLNCWKTAIGAKACAWLTEERVKPATSENSPMEFP